MWLIMSFISGVKKKEKLPWLFQSQLSLEFSNHCNSSISEILIDTSISLSQVGMCIHTLLQIYFRPNIWVFANQIVGNTSKFWLALLGLLVTLSIFLLGLWAIVFCLLWCFSSKPFLTPCLFIFFSLIYRIFINIDNLLYVKYMANIFPHAGIYVLSIYGFFDYTKLCFCHALSMPVFSFMAFGFGSCLESPSPLKDIIIFS